MTLGTVLKLFLVKKIISNNAFSVCLMHISPKLEKKHFLNRNFNLDFLQIYKHFNIDDHKRKVDIHVIIPPQTPAHSFFSIFSDPPKPPVTFIIDNVSVIQEGSLTVARCNTTPLKSTHVPK